jgi:hypothetical protein
MRHPYVLREGGPENDPGVLVAVKKNAHSYAPRNVSIYFMVGVKYSVPGTKDNGDTLLTSLQKNSTFELLP